LVLSVYNGFEALVKSLYSDFYSDCVIKPSAGKTIILTPELIASIKNKNTIATICLETEEKALLKNGEKQTVITLKGVDKNYASINGITNKINAGKLDLGTADEPHLLVGYGIQNAAEITVSDAIPSSIVTIILPKKTLNNNLDDAMSEGNCLATGVFAIQQEIDEKYAITNLDFMKAQLGLAADEYSAAEIKFKPNTDVEKAKTELQNLLGNKFEVQTRFEQNSNLYNTLKMEKWAIYAVLTLILIIAAFNMVSALSMLVLEKTKDIAILKSMGTTSAGIQKIFLAEGLLLGLIGTCTGIALALIICLLQIKYKFIKITGDTFLIDYFPVKFIAKDFVLVAISAIFITFFASWYPAKKAAAKEILLK
jgi:lipoprotein-releasing system permease protein